MKHVCVNQEGEVIVDAAGNPVAPDVMTCGECGRSWCERCDPTPGPLCHFCNGRGSSPAEIVLERKATYAWIIDRDLVSERGEATNREGWTGPRRAPGNLIADLQRRCGKKFRMLDDDGEVYYEGRWIGPEDSDEMFGPLDDFGTPDAGCTEIQYLNDRGQWETL